jgi:hypothetical protein
LDEAAVWIPTADVAGDLLGAGDCACADRDISKLATLHRIHCNLFMCKPKQAERIYLRLSWLVAVQVPPESPFLPTSTGIAVQDDSRNADTAISLWTLATVCFLCNGWSKPLENRALRAQAILAIRMQSRM